MYISSVHDVDTIGIETGVLGRGIFDRLLELIIVFDLSRKGKDDLCFVAS